LRSRNEDQVAKRKKRWWGWEIKLKVEAREGQKKVAG
jgi:hypothetical protein